MSPIHPRACLIVFAKAPVLGTVKTRMRPELSDEDCLALYRALLRQTLGKLQRWQFPNLGKAIFFSDCCPEVAFEVGELEPPSGIAVEFQVGQDLGERMTHALRKKWREGFRKVLFIGTDSPLISLQDIEAAIQALESHEIVIGPATDGGYYLIGFSSFSPFVLAGIQWGSSRVFEQTIQVLEARSMKWLSLREAFDLDSFEDLVRFQSLRPLSALTDSGSRELLSLVDRLIKGAQRR
jgi:uncharacterized protein